MLILVTNDDGVYAPGILALSGALGEVGRVVVAAPDRERSAASHSLTLNQPLRIEKLDHDRYAIDGTPTDCVHLAVNVILEGAKPDLLVSGINRGGNMGQDVTYSGTVWAALEGNLMGIPSFAISLVDDRYADYRPAAIFAARTARWIAENGLPEDTILNINVPDDPEQDLDKYLFTSQGYNRFSESVIRKEDPRGKSYYWIGGERLPFRGSPETDVGAVAGGYISVTPLHADMTNYGELESLKKLHPDNFKPGEYS
ncbi:MAG: 5'/3'-nucleotidase SurE [bacterium]|nr:MAG: 5'/3'-nucleotidase SurE [bacterium]